MSKLGGRTGLALRARRLLICTPIHCRLCDELPGSFGFAARSFVLADCKQVKKNANYPNEAPASWSLVQSKDLPFV